MVVTVLSIVSEGVASAGPPTRTVAPAAGYPASGEWTQFKRNLPHTGLNRDLTGRITADRLKRRWRTQIVDPGSRAAGSPVIARIGGTWQVIAAECGGGNCNSSVGGVVTALDGVSGDPLWTTPLPEHAQADPYAPLIEDVDADGYREIVVTANNANKVFALRAENEPGYARGTVQWTFTFDDGWSSEAAPTAANIDPSDGALEILLGTDSRNTRKRAKFYAIDGATGHAKGKPFRARRRYLKDARCVAPGSTPSEPIEINKIDSSAPAVAKVAGGLKIYVGAWDGFLYELEWRTSPSPGLYKVSEDRLPRFNGDSNDCSVRKVRDGAVVGQVVPGGPPEVVFGYMAEPTGQPDYPTARLRVVSADGLGLIADAGIPDWKSSPSLGDLLPGKPGLEIAGGRYKGVYAARVTAAGNLDAFWDKDIGDGNGGFGGNRSSPAIADIDNDGTLEVIEGIEGDVNTGMRAYNGRTGALEWEYPVDAPGVDGSPAVGDIDGDGKLEVVFFAIDGYVYALDTQVAASAPSMVQ